MRDYMHLQTVLNWSVFVDLLFVAIVAYAFTFMLFVGLADGMIFNKWAKFVEGKFLLKSFGGCMPCTSFWITVVFCLLFGIHDPVQILFTTALTILFIHKF